MRWRIIAGLSVVALVITLGGLTSIGQGPAVLASEAQDGGVPAFEVDASWPSMPNDWVLGQVSSVTVGPDDRIWVLHRPRTVGDDQGTAAPSVLAFEQDGTFVRAWGGPADGYDWPANEHGIHVAPDGNVWVGGNSAQPESDDMLLKFTPEGELLLQIGGRARSSGNDDTVNPMRPAESLRARGDQRGVRRRRLRQPARDRVRRRHRGVQADVGRLRQHAAGPVGGERRAGRSGGTAAVRNRPRYRSLGRRTGVRRRPRQQSRAGLRSGRDLHEAGLRQPGRRELVDGGRPGVLPGTRSNASCTRRIRATRTST